MSLHLPSRRVVRSVKSLTSSPTPLSSLIPCIHRRAIFGWASGFGKNRGSASEPRRTPVNPFTEEFLRKKPQNQTVGLVRGDLASSSIFEDKEQAGPQVKPAKKEPGAQSLVRNPDVMAAALDPDPVGRRLWERRMVIREIRKRGRLTKTQLLKKQERELLSRSHDFKTSVKKLVPLAKQIAGKTIDDAILQMRFSKKKAAKDVKEHLEHARNEAIVRRGMGLGLNEFGAPRGKMAPTKIQTKDGKRIKVTDPTTIYVDQAWCGKGIFGRSLDHRARGKINYMKNRTTSLTVLLKEEATRLRLHNEREEKIKNRKVWVQLPNRPITTQRQYYSW